MQLENALQIQQNLVHVLKKTVEKIISNIKRLILYILLFLFPFFFLNITQEYYLTTKFYFLGFGVLLLLLISTIQLIFSKKISWQKSSFDNLILLFITSVALSTLFSSPNKIQALLNPNLGLVMMIFLAILYFYFSRSSDPKEGGKTPPLQLISIILSLTTIVFYFQPLKNISLPQNLVFLKNPGFSPVGSQLDLAILLGFFVVLGIVSFPRRRESSDSVSPIRSGMTLVINLLALSLTIYSLIKPVTGLINQAPTITLPPFRLSWFSALEIIKNPKTAIIGIGPDNFSSIFTKVKDFAYNQSPLWQVNSFNVSRSAILQILTETGIFGLLTFGLLIFFVFKQFVGVGRDRPAPLILFVYLIICLFIFPPSLIIWFLFFMVMGLTLPAGRQVNQTPTGDVQTQNFASLPSIYLAIILVSLGLIGISGYFLGRSYASEYYFKKSIDAVASNKLKEVYNNQRQAVILNPSIEKFRINFAQTNLMIANNLAKNIKDNKISDQNRQTITQAIQAGIAEAKAAISLNPQKASNWESLGIIYRNIINVAQGSDVWTISAYQRAIVLDPKNPLYRVDLGGVYYSLGKYDEAISFFQQAIELKPDWSNAQYNYAWANFKKGNYTQAASGMQNVFNLMDPKLNKTDYEKVQKELAEFKKMLPKEEKVVSPEAK